MSGESSIAPAPLSCFDESESNKLTKFEHGRFVLVVGFDEPDKPVEADTRILQESGCRLWLLIKNSKPHSMFNGQAVYHAGNSMTRSMLVTFLKSLSLGELVLSKNLSVGEALKVFEYEGIAISGASPSTVCMPSSGLGFQKRDTGILHSISALCEKVADALVQWPKLEQVLESVVSDRGTSRSSSATAFTATATRAWIRFCERPPCVVDDGDHILSTATANPPWLTKGLVYLGIVHHRMKMQDPAFGKLRNEQSFYKLWKQVDSDNLGFFVGVRMDSFKSLRDDASRHEVAQGIAFAKEMRDAIMSDNSPNKPYARVAVMFVDHNRKITPSCARVFSGICADDNGETPERRALKKALKMRSVNVVKWSDTRDPNVRPLLFPPSFRDINMSQNGPSVLLSFENIM